MAKFGISQESIQKVKDAIDIVDVVEDFVTLKKAGKDYRGLSPFREEKTPSFFVVPNKNMFKDFSSGKAGDAFTFLEEHEGLSFIEAIHYLADKYGIKLDEGERSQESINLENEKEAVRAACRYANNYFKETLFNTKEGKDVGLSYFKQRGIPIDIVEKFELGYTLDNWSSFYDKANKEGYNKELLEKAGLVRIKDNRAFDQFRGRVMFPIFSVTGAPIAFAARTLKKDENPKYINSKETPIYYKSEVLYGIFQAKDAIRNNDTCYIVEGYIDVISMHIAGVKNVVAASGTALTEGHIKIIKRYTENIILLFDGDEAGISAAIRGVDIILQGGCNVKIASFPKGEDPDSYAQKLGAEGFQEYLKKETLDFIDFRIRQLQNKIDDPMTKVAEIDKITKTLAIIPDTLKRGVYVTFLAQKLNLDEKLIHATINKELLRIERKKQEQNQRNQRKLNSPIIDGNTENSQHNSLTLPSPPSSPSPSPFPNGDNTHDIPQLPSPPIESLESDENQEERPSVPLDIPPNFTIDDDGLIPTPEILLNTNESDFSEIISNDRVTENLEKEFVTLLLKYGHLPIDDDLLLSDKLLMENLKTPLVNKILQRLVDYCRNITFEENKTEQNLFALLEDDNDVKQVIVSIFIERYKVSKQWKERYDIIIPKDEEVSEKTVMSFFVRNEMKKVQQYYDKVLQEIREKDTIEEQYKLMKILQHYKAIEKDLASYLGVVIPR